MHNKNDRELHICYPGSGICYGSYLLIVLIKTNFFLWLMGIGFLKSNILDGWVGWTCGLARWVVGLDGLVVG